MAGVVLRLVACVFYSVYFLFYLLYRACAWIPLVALFVCGFVTFVPVFLLTVRMLLLPAVGLVGSGRPRVLLTGADRPECLHLARALHTLGYDTIAVSANGPLLTLTFYSRRVLTTLRVPSPSTQPILYAVEMMKLVERYGVRHFIALSLPGEQEADALASSFLSDIGVVCFATSYRDCPPAFTTLDLFYQRLLTVGAYVHLLPHVIARDLHILERIYAMGPQKLAGEGDASSRLMIRPLTVSGGDWTPLPVSWEEARRQLESSIPGQDQGWLIGVFPPAAAQELVMCALLVRGELVSWCVYTMLPTRLEVDRTHYWDRLAVHIFRQHNTSVLSGVINIRFLVTLAGGRCAVHGVDFSRGCDAGLLFLSSAGALSRILAAPGTAPQADTVSFTAVPRLVYSVYQEMMHCTGPARLLSLLQHHQETVLRCGDPGPFLAWYHLLLPLRLAGALIRYGQTPWQMDFITGRPRRTRLTSPCHSESRDHITGPGRTRSRDRGSSQDQPESGDPASSQDRPGSEDTVSSQEQPGAGDPLSIQDRLGSEDPVSGQGQPEAGDPIAGQNEFGSGSYTADPDGAETRDSVNSQAGAEPMDPADGQGQPESRDPADGQDQPESRDPTDGQDHLKPRDPTDGQDQPESRGPTDGQDQPKSMDPTDGQDLPQFRDPADERGQS